MPIINVIDELAGRVISEVSGDFTIEEIVKAISGSVQDPRFRPGFHILSDHTSVGAPLTTIQAKQMMAHLETLSKHLRGSRWAVVTTKAASYGMFRMTSVLAERIPMEIQVFHSHEDAEAWLTSNDSESS
jgi:hypothetical protein